MKMKSLLLVPAITCSLLATTPVLSQQSTDNGQVDAQQLEFDSIEANRSGFILGIVDQWRPINDARPEFEGWDSELFAALNAAPVDKLWAAGQASSYAEVTAAIYGAWTGPDVVPLSGDPAISAAAALGDDFIPAAALGDNFRDLVFTPLTPCRIIDTRFATGGFAGRLIAGLGKSFQVNLADFSAQGGFAGSCGIPTTLEVAAIAINVTSTDQTGNGNIRVIEVGSGVPNASLLNYQPGTNLANAAVVRSATGAGNDIFILSSGSDTHAVVDIMGYFAAPLITPVDQIVVESAQTTVNAGATSSLSSPNCPAGYRLTGGGYIWNFFDADLITVGSRANNTGANAATNWLCQGINTDAASRSWRCQAVCARIPGR